MNNVPSVDVYLEGLLVPLIGKDVHQIFGQYWQDPYVAYILQLTNIASLRRDIITG
jgi:hypothetical protein